MRTSFILILGIAVLTFNNLNAQENDITVAIQRNDDKSISLSYTKQTFGTYNISVLFTQLENARQPLIHKDIVGSSGNIITIKPSDPNKHINCSYRYWTIRGELKPKFDSEFIYLLPISTIKQSKVKNLSNVNTEYFDAQLPENWIYYQFLTEVGDTVYTARRGTVVQIIGEQNYNEQQTVLYQSSANSIIIEHKDGTLASYKGFNKNHILVEEGEKVYPHTALGTLAKYDERDQGQLRFGVYYLSQVCNAPPSKTSIKDKFHYYSYINPLFLTQNGVAHLKTNESYKGITNQEIIEKELSKREIKKRKK